MVFTMPYNKPCPTMMEPRRSGRITTSQKQKAQLELILNTSDPQKLGLIVKETPFMGRGVFADRIIEKNQYVVEYAGEFCDEKETRMRHQEVGDTGYVFWMQISGKKWVSVDGTAETQHPGRLINHSKNNFNLVPKKVPGMDRLVLKSVKQINKGDQLFFNYGEDRKEVIKANIWMK